jgi:hypothetical protein
VHATAARTGVAAEQSDPAGNPAVAARGLADPFVDPIDRASLE